MQTTDKAVNLPAPGLDSKIRVAFLWTATSGWYQADKKMKETHILPLMKATMDSWKNLEVTLLGTLDNDLFSSGPNLLGWHAIFLYDVPNVVVVNRMTNSIRDAGLDAYMALQAIIGRPYFLLEDVDK